MRWGKKMRKGNVERNEKRRWEMRLGYLVKKDRKGDRTGVVQVGGGGAFENRRPSYAYVTFCIVLHINSPNLGELGGEGVKSIKEGR